MRRLTTTDLMRKLGFKSRETVRTRRREIPDFPKPVHDEGSTVAYYLEDEVDAYIARQREKRDREARVSEGSR
jgi:predicted DNA-binding transcriptional regulator AlpA